MESCGWAFGRGEVRTVSGTAERPIGNNGVYEAQVEMWNPATNSWVSKSNTLGGVSTMFPKDWSAERLKSEVDFAFANKTLHTTPGKWQGTTPSGVKVEGWLSPNTTVFPSAKQ